MFSHSFFLFLYHTKIIYIRKKVITSARPTGTTKEYQLAVRTMKSFHQIAGWLPKDAEKAYKNLVKAMSNEDIKLSVSASTKILDMFLKGMKAAEAKIAEVDANRPGSNKDSTLYSVDGGKVEEDEAPIITLEYKEKSTGS